MNVNEYDDEALDDDSYLETGVLGFEIAYGSENKISTKQKSKRKLKIKRKLDEFQDSRRLALEIDTLYGEWEH